MVVKLYVIVAYDVSVSRVNKVKSYLRTKLTWIQNSLFEGELSEGQLIELKSGLHKRVVEEKDSVVLFILGSKSYAEKLTIGISKGDSEQIVI